MRILTFTNHAASMLQARTIERKWAERVLQAPEWVRVDPGNPDIKQAFGRISEAKGKMLRVVYTETRDERRVITVFFDRDAIKPSGQSQ